MIDANKELQTAQNIKNLIYEGRQNLASDLNERLSIEDKLNELNADTKYQNELKKLFNKIGGFGSMSKEEREKFKNDWVGYLGYKVPDRVGNIRQKSYFDMYKSRANDYRRMRSPIN